MKFIIILILILIRWLGVILGVIGEEGGIIEDVMQRNVTLVELIAILFA